MFSETSRWHIANRRGFAALERLNAVAGFDGLCFTGPPDELPPQADKQRRAVALVTAGWLGVPLMIDTSANLSGSTGRDRSIWKAMRPETGARAAVFVTHGLAAISGQLATAPNHHLDAGRQREARNLLADVYPWSEADEARIEKEVREIDPSDGSGYDEAFISIAFLAIEQIFGSRTAELPGFALLGGDMSESYHVGLAWKICHNHVVTPYLRLSDPHGMRVWEAQSERH